MPEVRITVCVPTTGRATLARTLGSAEAADEVLVDLNEDGDHGYAARTRMMQKATGTHLAFLDDDDIYLPGAIELMRRHAAEVPVIFRMDDRRLGLVWKMKEVVHGNVGTPMLLVPNDPARLGVWEPYRPKLAPTGGDFTFIRGCCERMGAPVWRHEVVALIRPDLRKQAA